MVWNIVTGVKDMQFTAYEIEMEGYTEIAEVTAMNFDATYRRLLTCSEFIRLAIHGGIYTL